MAAKAQAAMKAAEQALPYIEEAANHINELILHNQEEKAKVKVISDRIDKAIKGIQTKEKWFKDKGIPIPKVGGAGEFMKLVKDTVKRIISNFHGRKVIKLTEEATALEANDEFLADEMRKVGGSGPKRSRSRSRGDIRGRVADMYPGDVRTAVMMDGGALMRGNSRYGMLTHMPVGAHRDMFRTVRTGGASDSRYGVTVHESDMRADPDYFSMIR